MYSKPVCGIKLDYGPLAIPMWRMRQNARGIPEKVKRDEKQDRRRHQDIKSKANEKVALLCLY